MKCINFAIIIFMICITAYAQNDPFPGNPPICPKWAFEPWIWEDSSNTQISIETLVQNYLDHNIPVGAVIIDSPWETYYNTFEWDTTRYSNPQKMIDDFHNKGVKVIMWITGFINTDSPDYNYVKSQNFVVDNGTDHNWWKGRGVHLDFTNDDAKNWWHGKMDNLLFMNCDGWKVDMGADRLADMVTTNIGYISKDEFKKYYYADLYDYSISTNPYTITVARAYSFQGGIGASISKSPISWLGDYHGDFAGLNEQKNDVYESALRGYSAPGVEVGGYYHTKPSKSSLIRYAQFAALTPLMENGGANGGLAEHLPCLYS